jgi:lipid-A-disaccharide synthase
MILWHYSTKEICCCHTSLHLVMTYTADILILSNGPGELTTWVRPVVMALARKLGGDRPTTRISLVLSPCPNASGNEVDIARRYPEIDRIQAAEHFFPFLLFGKTADHWDWCDRGVVVFLGGDQVYPIVIGKRLGYRTVIYGEWETRWHRWGDRYGVMNASVIQKVPARYADKLTIVGDLMASAAADMPSSPSSTTQSTHASARSSSLNSSALESSQASAIAAPTIGLLPGSKPAKLAQGVPLCLAIAHHIHQSVPHARFMIPVAPTLELETLARFARGATNPVLYSMGGIEATLIRPKEQTKEQTTDPTTPAQLRVNETLAIDLHTQFPAYEELRQCQICVTTVGANTAELGALGIPMVVLLPTQHLEAMKAWDGLPGLLAHLPGVGDMFARLINRWFLRKKRLLAWPNIWAGEEIVPELVGELQPQDIATQILDYLDHPEILTEMGDRLRRARGPSGAAERLATLVLQELNLQAPST